MAGTHKKVEKRAQNSQCTGAEVRIGRDLYIPELEEAKARASSQYRPWTPEEDEVLLHYYGFGMTKAIAEYFQKAFPPGRSINSIQNRAKLLGLTGRPRKDDK